MSAPVPVERIAALIGHDSCCKSLDTHAEDAIGRIPDCDCELDRRASAVLAELDARPTGDAAERAREAIKDRLYARLNAHLCEMKEGYDDSIVGFNEAWDVMRGVLDSLTPPQREGESRPVEGGEKGARR